MQDIQQKDDRDNRRTLCLPTSICGQSDDYTASGGEVGVSGITFVSRDADEDCHFEKPVYAQDADCSSDTDNCDMGLRCAINLVERDDSGNV